MKNRLLAALPAEEYERLRPWLETVLVKVPTGVDEEVRC